MRSPARAETGCYLHGVLSKEEVVNWSNWLRKTDRREIRKSVRALPKPALGKG
jgi:hypothetical protein